MARCEDLVGDYNCHCLPGYHVKNCENGVLRLMSNLFDHLEIVVNLQICQ